MGKKKCIALCLITFVCIMGNRISIDNKLNEPDPILRKDAVILIHGLGRTSWSLIQMEWHLRKMGYAVFNLDFPAAKNTIEYISSHYLAKQVEALNRDFGKIHFVTHSFGGIILRYYLKDHQIPNIGRVVMLSPPNQGSLLTDKLRNNKLYRYLTGPAGQQTGTDKKSIPSQLGPVDFELGVIAGNVSLNPILSFWIPGEDDGKLSINTTKVSGMKDFLLVPFNHTYIMEKPEVISEVVHFLGRGRFSPTLTYALSKPKDSIMAKIRNKVLPYTNFSPANSRTGLFQKASTLYLGLCP
ncbi:MAG: alpha/beta fold hydrolase [Desulfobacula sp.]|nr:alpha/beta fold hydrolase [Desulfobacula sp.]